MSTYRKREREREVECGGTESSEAACASHAMEIRLIGLRQPQVDHQRHSLHIHPSSDQICRNNYSKELLLCKKDERSKKKDYKPKIGKAHVFYSVANLSKILLKQGEPFFEFTDRSVGR